MVRQLQYRPLVYNGNDVLSGDIMQINVLGQPTVILSSLKCAKDLLETRGSRATIPFL